MSIPYYDRLTGDTKLHCLWPRIGIVLHIHLERPAIFKSNHNSIYIFVYMSNKMPN